MAITVQSTEQGADGSEFNLQDVRAEIIDINGDNAYPTGGSTPVASVLGYQRIVAFIPLNNPGYVLNYHPETDKLQVFYTGAAVSSVLAEVANATNLSAVLFRALVLGQ